MNNIFRYHIQQHNVFMWEKLGNITEGRATLGENMPVQVYRLMAFTLLETLSAQIGRAKAAHYFNEAGRLAGYEFALSSLDLTGTPEEFAQHLQAVLLELKIGVFRVEHWEPLTGKIVVLLENDFSTSGVPDSDETRCKFEEGFIAGILYAYTGEDHQFQKVTCWSPEDKRCRMTGRAMY